MTGFVTPLSLFRQGMDTYDIAKHLGCSEATVVKLIDTERNEERKNMPSPIELPALIRYAGYDRTTMPWGGA